MILHSRSHSRADAEIGAWLGGIHVHLAEKKFWTSWLPPRLRAERRYKLLRSAGLPNAENYRELYPDLLAAGTDPLRHNILHGMEEGRERPV